MKKILLLLVVIITIVTIIIVNCNEADEYMQKNNELVEVDNENVKTDINETEKNSDNITNLKNVYKSIFNVDVLPIIISFISLLISFWILYKNKKSLNVAFSNDECCVSNNEVFSYDSFGKKKTYENGLFVILYIVNPSPSDIAYFELEPTNKYDENAIKVMHKDTHVGYLPRYYSESVREYIKDRATYECKVLEVNKDMKCHECVLIKLEISIDVKDIKMIS